MNAILDFIYRRRYWLLIVLFVWGMLRLVLDLDATLTSPPALQELVVPASQIVGGVELLSPGRVIGFTVYVPNDKSTPVSALRTTGEVRGVAGADAKTIVLAVPAAAAPTLEAGLLNANTRLTYHLLAVWPTDTPTPTTTFTPTAPLISQETPTITPTPTPAAGKVLWALPLAKNRTTLDVLPAGAAARLVILADLPPGTGTGTPVPPTAYTTCIQLVAFLDAAGNRLDAFAQAAAALVEIGAADLSSALLNLKYATDLYVVPDQSCKGG